MLTKWSNKTHFNQQAKHKYSFVKNGQPILIGLHLTLSIE